MIIIDTKYEAAVLDYRGYHRMDKEKLYRRLYGSFAEGPGKTGGRYSRTSGRR